MTDFLMKLFSKALFQRGAELVQSQPAATTKEEGDANRAAVKAGIRAYIEELDGKLELIPFAGPWLAAFADTPEAEAKEDEAAEFVVSLLYYPIKYADALGGAQ